MSKSRVVPDMQIFAKEDKREEWLQLSLKTNLPDEPVHGYRSLRTIGPAIFSQPVQTEFTPDGAGSLNQLGGIHVEVFSTVEVTQETDAAEEIADKVFKC